MKRLSLWLSVAAVAICQGSPAQNFAKAQNQPAATATANSVASATIPAQEAKAIAALVASFTKAFNDGDAPAAAATFALDALVIDEQGERTEGRARIQAQLVESFAASPHRTIVIETTALRLLGPDTALEEGRTTISPAKGGPPEISRFVVVYVKHDGRWLQSAVRDEHAHDLTPHDHLKELAWLVGEWINESQDAVVNTTCKWSEDGNFLIRDFTMKSQGQPVLSGTQRIGWDPSRHQFKTWIFDSEGGFGEGYWTRNGDQWLIKAEGVRQDGKHASATNIITRLGKDRASWQSVDRTIGGAAVPGVDEFTIVRKPPEAGK
jgi:uncharacterized protein (TIGR02246 family)